MQKGDLTNADFIDINDLWEPLMFSSLFELYQFVFKSKFHLTNKP